LIVNDEFAIPVKPSGCLYHLPIPDTFPVSTLTIVIATIGNYTNESHGGPPFKGLILHNSMK